MHDLITECARNLGTAPRDFSLWDRLTYLHVAKPLWLRTDPADGLTILFRHMPRLFREGTVVWGHIIQANQLMFQEGKDNCPGELVYTLADAREVEPEYLQQVARELYSLKGTEPDDQQLAPIAEYLTDELIRVFGLAVPPVVSPGIRCRISTTFFVRKHLPGQRLCTPLLPIVVNPRDPHVAMPLPERFWPEELAEWWSQ